MSEVMWRDGLSERGAVYADTVVGRYLIRRAHKGAREFRLHLNGSPTKYHGTVEQLQKVVQQIIDGLALAGIGGEVSAMSQTGFVRSLLDISDAHLRQETRDMLDGLAGDPIASIMVAASGYGWITAVPETEDDSYPSELRAAWRLAHSLGCEFVSFDRDAPSHPELEEFE